MTLFGKFQHEIKKKGQQLTEDNAAFTLGIFKRVVEEVNLLTQDEHNDKCVK